MFIQKKEEMAYNFKPKTNTDNINLDLSKYGGEDFLSRVVYHKIKQEKKIEDIRNKYVDPDTLEYTFKPQISKTAKILKRGLNDLYVYKEIFTFRFGRLEKKK